MTCYHSYIIEYFRICPSKQYLSLSSLDPYFYTLYIWSDVITNCYISFINIKCFHWVFHKVFNQESMSDSSMYVEKLWFGSHSTGPTTSTMTICFGLLNVIIRVYILSWRRVIIGYIIGHWINIFLPWMGYTYVSYGGIMWLYLA